MQRATNLTRSDASVALRKQAQRGPVLYSELDRPLQRAVLIHWGSLREARKAIGLRPLPAARQLWSKERVLVEIRNLHSRGQHMSTVELARAGRMDLIVAAKTYLGSWGRARSLAGIPFSPMRTPSVPVWDASAVIVEIVARHRAALALAVTKAPKSLTSAGIRIFGSWKASIEAAGFGYDTVRLRRTYEDAELLAWMRQLASMMPTLTLFQLDQHGEHAVVCRRRWGSFEAAAKAAGLVDWPRRLRRPALSRAAVLAALRKRRAAGASLTLANVRREEGGEALVTSTFHHFPRWSLALAAVAGASRTRIGRGAGTREVRSARRTSLRRTRT